MTTCIKCALQVVAFQATIHISMWAGEKVSSAYDTYKTGRRWQNDARREADEERDNA